MYHRNVLRLVPSASLPDGSTYKQQMIVSAIMGQEIQLSIHEHGWKIATGISGNWLCGRQAKFSEICVSSLPPVCIDKNLFVVRPIPQNTTTTLY
jgi:hypothetical protein